MSSGSSASNPQSQPQSTVPLRATVTGVDTDAQLFRDSVRVIFLKNTKCIYLSKIKPSSDSILLIEIPNRGETWRSDASIRDISADRTEPDTFRVTLELERAHSAVVDVPEPEPPAEVEEAASNVTPFPSPPNLEAPILAPPPAPAFESRQEFAPLPSFPRRRNLAPPIPPPEADEPAKASAPPQAVKAAVKDAVRAIMASEFEQWKRDIQNSFAGQIDAAFQQPLQRLEAKLEQKQNPAITQETMQRLAAEAAETVVAEWAATRLPKLIAEAVRVGLAANATRQAAPQELRAPAAATQQKANQLIQELHQKMLAFSAEMERLVAPQTGALPATNYARPAAPEPPSKARSGAPFGDSDLDLDSEISAALEKLLGKS